MSTSPDDLIGRTLDARYRIESVAARGGMATIYLAIDLRLQRPVAVKVMHSTLAEDANFLIRFEREARAAAALTHPNVVSVHDQGRDAATGAMYLIMELVAGHTVRDVLVERISLTPIQALAVLDPVLQALAAAHQAGFVHRDIKPENVMIADDGRVRVADFGLARAIVDTESTALTRGVLIGTVAYLAPEQVEKGTADERSDIYSAGILLFEMLTGKVPYSGDSPIAVAFQHVHSSIPLPTDIKPELSPTLDMIVAKATHRDPASRYQTADDFLRDVRQVRDIIEGKAAASSFGTNQGSGPATAQPDETHTVVLPLSDAQRISFGGVGTVDTDFTPPATVSESASKKGWKRGRVIKFGVYALIVAALIFGGLQWFNRVSVPQLVGKQAEQALADLTRVELKGVIAEKVFNDITEPGTVLSANPKSGEAIAKGSEVQLVISKGPEKMSVPSVVGLTQADAKTAIVTANLAIGSIRETYNSQISAGTVISSTPTAGLKVKAGTKVNLVISKGPQPISLPAVVGKSYAKGSEQLRARGFTNITQSTQYSNKVAKGVIISMTPKAGTTGFSDTKITLLVSKGLPPVKVPSVTGFSATVAKSKLSKLGLKASVSISKCKKGKPKSSLINDQSPLAGAEVAKGSTVKLWGVYICS